MALPPKVPLHTLLVSVVGNGRVIDAASGIDCPGLYSLLFQ